MKRSIVFLLFCIGMAACSVSDPGPEFSTPANISNPSISPDHVTEKDQVTVSADIYNQYGAFQVCINYMLEGAQKWESVSLKTFAQTTETIRYTGTIPPQPAGSKVLWRVVVYSYYSVVTSTDVFEYSVYLAPTTETEQ